MINNDGVAGRFRAGSLFLLAALLMASPGAPQQEQTNEAVASSARNFRFEIFDYPETADDPVRFTKPRSINDAGVVVGDINRYKEGEYGFIYDSGKFTLLAGPLFNGRFTSAIAVNNRGQILIAQDPQSSGSPIRYFIYDRAQRTFSPVGSLVQIAGAPHPIRLNPITGFNDEEQFVGNVGFGNRQYGGYGTLPIGAAGSTTPPTEPGHFTRIDCPDGRSMNATSISSHGLITGCCDPAPKLPLRSGFVFSHGSVTLFDVPGAGLTRGNGINDAGVVAGEYTLKPLHAGLWPSTGFAYDGSQFAPVVASPGDPTHGGVSIALAINNKGQIAGMDSNGNGNHGFVASAKTGNPLRLSGGAR